MYRLMVKDKRDGRRFGIATIPGDMIEKSDDLWTMIVMQDRFKYSFGDDSTTVVVDGDGKEVHTYTCYDGTVITF